MKTSISAEKRERMIGLMFTIGVFLFWGLYPPYWKLLQGVPPFQVFAHRVLWSCVFTACVITIQGRWAEVRRALRSRKTVLTLLASGVCITSNWSIYIIGVFSGKLLAVSMGYFINPLVSVLLGVVILRERLRFWQIVAVLCACGGVLYMSLGYQGLPWISMSLALSFGMYGLLRKTVAVESIPGTFIESLLVSPILISFLLFEAVQGRSAFGTAEASTHLLLISSGIVTALPIILFTSGVRRIPLSLVGVLQYLAPTSQLLLGIFLYKEEFTRTHLISFGLIWVGILIFILSAFMQRTPRFSQGRAGR